MLRQIFEQLKLATTPQFVRNKFPEALWQVNTEQKAVYLTFDDGPTPDVTDQVLGLLDKYNAKATFFCIGDNVKKYPDLFHILTKKGHAVGNHTYHHISGWQNGDELYLHNIAMCAELVDSTLFRPPFGQIKTSQYKRLKENYTIVMWSALSWDFDVRLSPQQCAKNILNHTQNGSIIVFHDSKKAEKNCIPALQQVLEKLSQKEYKFLPLPNKQNQNI